MVISDAPHVIPAINCSVGVSDSPTDTIYAVEL